MSQSALLSTTGSLVYRSTCSWESERGCDVLQESITATSNRPFLFQNIHRGSWKRCFGSAQTWDANPMSFSQICSCEYAREPPTCFSHGTITTCKNIHWFTMRIWSLETRHLLVNLGCWIFRFSDFRLSSFVVFLQNHFGKSGGEISMKND